MSDYYTDEDLDKAVRAFHASRGPRGLDLVRDMLDACVPGIVRRAKAEALNAAAADVCSDGGPLLPNPLSIRSWLRVRARQVDPAPVRTMYGKPLICEHWPGSDCRAHGVPVEDFCWPCMIRAYFPRPTAETKDWRLG